MPKIIISYRRRDSEAITGRIFDRLIAHYGKDAVFRDIDNIPPGIDFRSHIADALAHSDILLAIVGPNWGGRRGRAGRARIDDEDDLVRIEVETALVRGIPIIPVLLGSTKMPSADHVPGGVKEFVFRQAVRVDPGRDFEHHLDGLTREIDRILGVSSEVPALEPQIEASRPASPNPLTASASSTTSSSSASAAPRLSIVVLPFANLNNDPDQEYIADGITDDLTTDLSRLPGMFVISRNTAFTYRNRSVDTKQIGRELGVRYLLEGSIRRWGSRVRVNAQLIDAEVDEHLWAERFDGDTGGLLGLQDEITSRIAIALDLELVDAEAGRAIEYPDAQDYILRARAARLKSPSRENRGEAVDHFERALALDQQSVAAQSWLAIALMARVLDNMASTAETDILRAEELAQRALAESPRSSLAHFAKGQVSRALDRYDEAILEYEAVVALNRNWADAYSHLGWCKFVTGSIEEIIPAQEQAIRLSPRDPQIGLFYGRIGHGHLLQSRASDAIIWYEKARNASPRHASTRISLASAYALEGRSESAALELAEARRLSGDGRFSSIARLKAGGISWRSSGYWGVPKIRTLFEATYFAGLRRAGMSEE
jgi:TolB-like protein